MYTPREIKIIQDFREKYPNIPELNFDVINMLAYTAVEIRDETPKTVFLVSRNTLSSGLMKESHFMEFTKM